MSLGDSYSDFLVGIVVGLFFGYLVYLAYTGNQQLIDNQKKINEIKENIFKQIDHNTTNAQILNIINNGCVGDSSFVSKCKDELTDKFIISARN